MQPKFKIILFFIAVLPEIIYSQCQNSMQYPSYPVTASAFNDTVLVTDGQFAGQFYIIEGLLLDETYVFVCSGGGTYLTIRDVYNPTTVITHGVPPLTWTVPSGGPDLVAVHVSLLSPPCGVEDGTEATPRTSQFVCNTCTGLPPSVGIGVGEPEAVLDVSGEIRVGDVQSPPKAGMIRWNPITEDFEGYNGSRWLSFTQSMGEWGRIPAVEANENIRAEANEGEAFDYFGSAVSLSGEWAICGASDDDIGPNGNQGSVTLFNRSDSSWVEVVTLHDPNGESNDYFGAAVSISGDYAVVGVTGDDIGSNAGQGSATVFHRTGNDWTLLSQVIATDGATVDLFGYSVGISGDYLIVGAPYADIGDEPDQGAAYVFKRSGNNWLQEAKLIASDGVTSDQFGYSVSLHGEYAIIGSHYDDVGTNADQGSAYIFKRTGTNWNQESKLTALDGTAGDYFGTAVSISENSAVVGAPFTVEGNISQGATYVFNRVGNTWTQVANLIAEDGTLLEFFGYSVSIFGNAVLVGAIRVDAGGVQDSGCAFLYHWTGTHWEQKAKLTASDKKVADQFGWAVSISEDALIIGAPYHDVGSNSNQGSVYFFNKNQ